MSADDAVVMLCEEFGKATRKHGVFPSLHHGHSVIEEEFEELWQEIKMGVPDVERMRLEAAQLGAAALRFMVDCL